MFLMFEAARERITNEHNNRAWLAWNIVALDRSKRLPNLDKLMIRRRGRTPQTLEEQRAVLRMIASTYGARKLNG